MIVMWDKNGKRILDLVGEKLWLVFILIAVLVVSFSSLASRGSDFTHMASSRMEKVIDKRLDILEEYMVEAINQPLDQWMELKNLPSDMIVYRYVYDTLQSWNNQFAIENDDIDNKLVIKRLANPKYNIESQLTDVTSQWQFLNVGPKWYIIKKITDGIRCQVIAGLEIKSMIGVQSRNGVNRRLKLSDRFALYPISYAGGAPVMVKGVPLIKVVQEDANVLPMGMMSYVSWLAITLILLAFLLYLLKRRTIKHMLLTVANIVVAIVTFYLLGRRLDNTTAVFSPNIYAQGDFFYSLGALLLVNTAIFLIVCCVYMVGPALIRMLLRPKHSRFCSALFGFAILLSVAGIIFYIHRTFSGIVVNSNISLELYKISEIDRYTIYVYVSYMALLVTIPMLLQLLRPLVRHYLHIRYNVNTRVWRMIFCILCSLYLLLTSTILSSRKEASNVGVWANSMSVDRNMGFELQLKNIENYIANDPLVFRLVSISGDYSIVLGRIRETYLNKIAQDYDLMMNVFEDDHPDQTIVDFFNERIKDGTQISDDSRFYYTRTTSGRARYTAMFVYYVPSRGVVRIFIGIDSKVDKAGRGYSAISGAVSSNSGILLPHYSYCKYLNGKLVTYKGEYAYPTVLPVKMGLLENGETSTWRIIDQYVHFINKVADDEIIIISRPKNDYMQYLMSFLLMALLCYMAVSILSLFRQRPSVFEKNYYSSRINTLFFLSLTATLVIMAVISVIFVYRRNDANTKSIMISKINTIQSLVEATSTDLHDYNEFNSSKMRISLRNISDYTRSDLTLYTKDGRAFRSTAPDAFDKLILVSRMPQDAYRSIMYQNRRYYIQKEFFCNQPYYNMYAPIFNKKGDMLAILGAPFTDSGLDFMNDAVTHSIFIITLFFILLIVTRMLTGRVIERMFKPLINMGSKMMSARNGGLEYIIYDREDEITSVVRAYNLMVHDLSVSLAQLTVAERDKAWREMARQVAHEIKTPLTPIKLQIQRLQRLRSKKSPNWEERFDSILPTIITSIDQLADTANDFSSFAKLYSEEHQLINLDKMVNEIVNMFSEKDNMTFEYIGLNDAMIMGPKPQLYRVFVNLITNAIQAIENEAREQQDAGGTPGMGYIRLSLRNSNEGEFYDVVFEDNGPGVKDEVRNKLFVPNFTTKSGGSGLGLAISKNILEVCGGTITYSKSFTLRGACFTVKLPKYKQNP